MAVKIVHTYQTFISRNSIITLRRKNDLIRNNTKENDEEPGDENNTKEIDTRYRTYLGSSAHGMHG